MSERNTRLTKPKPKLRPKCRPSPISASDWEKLKAAEKKALEGLVVLRKLRGETLH